MSPRRRCSVAVAAAALLAGSLGAWRARDLGPGLDIVVERAPREGRLAPYKMTVSSRGGEVLREVAIEPAGPWIEIRGPRAARNLRPGVAMVTILAVDEAAGPARVTVVQRARVDRRYDVDLAVRAR